jgi:hypothetical protein
MLTPVLNNYGIGVFITDSAEALGFNHTGHNTGYKCIMVGFPNQGTGAVILANSETSSPFIFELLGSIAREYNWPHYQPMKRVVAKVDNKTYKDFKGEYEFGKSNFVVSVENKRLYIIAPPLGQNKIELFPMSKDKYFVLTDLVTFTFIREKDGLIKELLVEPPDTKFTLKKVK